MIPRSRWCLIAHTTTFLLFVFTSFVSSYLILTHKLTGQAVLIAIGAVALVASVFWIRYKGDCPFTVWENSHRIREGKKAYEGSCIIEYARTWFGIELPRNADNYIIGVVFALPTTLALIRELF